MSQPLGVLHVHSGNLYGGVEAMLISLAGQRAELLQQTYALCFSGPLEDTLRRKGVALTTVGAVRLSRPWTVLRARKQLRQLISRRQPDVVVCHSPWSLIVFGPAIRDAETPLALWLHAPPTGRGWLERLSRWHTPDLVICNSEFTRSSLPRLFPEVSSVVVYPPVTPPTAPLGESRRLQLRRELNTPPAAVVIVQVSRLEAWKGQRVLLDVLAQMSDLPSWVCWQVGTPQRRKEVAYLRSLERHARALGLAERVRFVTGYADVRSLLGPADVFCQPNTESEPFGIVFVEALYAGLPVVSYAMGGAVEIVDPACGILVTPHDTDALRAALERLITDPSLRTRLGKAGPSKARAMCEPDAGAERLASVLQKVS